MSQETYSVSTERDKSSEMQGIRAKGYAAGSAAGLWVPSGSKASGA